MKKLFPNLRDKRKYDINVTSGMYTLSGYENNTKNSRIINV